MKTIAKKQLNSNPSLSDYLPIFKNSKLQKCWEQCLRRLKKKTKKKRKNEYDTPRDQVCKKIIKVAIDDGLERRHLSRVYECSNCFKDYI